MASYDTSFEKIIGVARHAFDSRKTRPISFRVQQLKNFHRMITECTEEIQNAVAKDLKKHKHEVSLYELESIKFDSKYMAKELKKWAAPDKLPFNLLAAMDSGYVEKVPYGLVLILGAWNYPILLTLQPMIGAIAAGNCIILKPSELSQNVAALLAKMIPEYLDQECYHVIQAGPEETQQLLTNKFDYIFYTGSTTVGRIVMTAAAKHLCPVTLELGGKSPCYIDESSNFEIAAKRLLWGRFMNMGQTCVAPDYLLISKRAEDAFLKAAGEVMKEWYGTNPQRDTNVPRIINEKHCLRLKRLLDTTKGRIAIGGNVDVDDLWIEPTIVADVTSDDALMQEEIFGPILPIVNVNNVEEAIQFINARPRPLALYTFSNNDKTNQKIVNETLSGGVCVNDVMWQAVWHGLPFGGIGDSGMGNYHGKSSYETFSHQRSVLNRSFGAFSEKLGEARYLPYTDLKTSFFTFVIQNFASLNVSFGSVFTHFLVFLLGIAVVFLGIWLGL